MSTNGGAPVPVVYDDALKEANWSPDGSKFADVEGGGERGIWTYGSEAPRNHPEEYVWALEDPTKPENKFETTFSDVTWIGTSRIVFGANYNLWTIPASCGEAPHVPATSPPTPPS